MSTAIASPDITREEFATQLCLFVDRHGTVLGSGSNPGAAWLSMKYEKGDVAVHVQINSSPQTNGRSYVKVTVREEVVFEGTGCYIAQIACMRIQVDKPGDWEKIFEN